MTVDNCVPELKPIVDCWPATVIIKIEIRYILVHAGSVFQCEHWLRDCCTKRCTIILPQNTLTPFKNQYSKWWFNHIDIFYKRFNTPSPHIAMSRPADFLWSTSSVAGLMCSLSLITSDPALRRTAPSFTILRSGESGCKQNKQEHEFGLVNVTDADVSLTVCSYKPLECWQYWIHCRSKVGRG